MKKVVLCTLAVLFGLIIVATPVVAKRHLFLPLIPGFPIPEPCYTLCIAQLQYTSADEYVEIENRSQQAQDLTGWRLHSLRGDQWYEFPTGYILSPGGTVCVHSGAGAFENPPDHLLWTKAHRWNDAGDTAHLVDNQGNKIDAYTYGEPAPWLAQAFPIP